MSNVWRGGGACIIHSFLCAGLQHYYAYSTDTGETIIGLGEDGNATGVERRYSQWRLPNEDMSEAALPDLYAWVEYEDETDPSVASMSVEEGTEWYSKRYDGPPALYPSLFVAFLFF